MQLKIQVVVDDEHGETVTQDIFSLDKSSEGDGLAGLSLAESKRRIKGSYDIRYRTLFGIVSVPNARLYHCKCEEANSKTFGVLNDWLSDHNSPELPYIETKWASLLSYGLTVD